MRVSLSWLKQLVDYKLNPKDLADKLSLLSIGVKGFSDDFLELDLTYNRGDLLSMRGVAREIAAITNSKLKLENLASPKSGLPEVSVTIESPNLSPVYCVAKIEGLKVAPSNTEWTKKLGDCGIRSINNVADVTNLIMLEYGQPMHAFDAQRVTDETLVVRTAKPGETLITLDGKTRKLDTEDLLITDPKKPLGMAGVMGGKDSEISNTTTTILLEAAIFDPIANRKTSKRHGLYSEASKRFQHGLTKTNLLQALAAAIKMYEGLGGKLTALTLTGNLEDQPKTVNLTQQKLNSLIGIDIPATQVEESLNRLGFTLASNPRGWNVAPPYWRLDCNIEEDLIEEVARIYGYEKIPARELTGEKPEKLDESLQDLVNDLKTELKKAGLTEVQTYPFFSSKIIENCKLQIENLVKIANPISAETEYLKDQLWPNLIEVVARNLKNGLKDIAIFEIGKTYKPKKGGAEEKYHLSIALMNGTDNPIAELLSISRGVNLPHTGCVQKGKLFHPKKITSDMAEVHPRILNKLGIEKRVAILEVELSYSSTETFSLSSA